MSHPVQTIHVKDLFVPDNRIRREHNEEALVELSESIARNGVLHPLVVRRDNLGRITLVAGERRLRALDILWQTGQPVRVGPQALDESHIPIIYLGELDPLDAMECELDENIRRSDFTWQERSQAIAALNQYREARARQQGTIAPTVESLADEVGHSTDLVKEALIVSRYLDVPEVAKAPNVKEALKVIKRAEETERSRLLGEKIGETFSSADHTLIQGNCIEKLRAMPDGVFDVILTDPPYGMDAQDFGTSGNKTPGGHFYDDSYSNWANLMAEFVVESYRVAAPLAHAYVFCDIDNFHKLRDYMSAAGWKCFRTPIIWVNPSGMRAPWPEGGPQRKYQLCLFASKGNKIVTKLYPDVITCGSDKNLNHHAQKPVSLYQDLLVRSVKPGDSVLDAFCGSGPIFPACHGLRCRATGIELDPAAYGIAAKRLMELK